MDAKNQMFWTAFLLTFDDSNLSASALFDIRDAIGVLAHYHVQIPDHSSIIECMMRDAIANSQSEEG